MSKQWSTAFSALGLAIFFAGLLGYYVRSAWTWFEYSALAVGGVLILAYIILNFREIVAALTQRGALQTGNAVLMALLLLAILSLVNFLATRHSKRVDTTAARQFSLSEQSVKVLQGLQDELTITAFFLPQDQERIQDTFKEFAAITPKFKYEFVDPDKKPDLARQLGITAFGTTVVSYRGKNEKINGQEEGDLTNAIIKVTRATKKKVYFTVNHGEKSLDNSERLGLSAAKAVIQEKNYEIGTVALMDSNRVPADCAVLVIAGAQTPFLSPEIEAIKNYLDTGGAIYILADPDAPSFREIVSDWGISVRNDLIVDFSGVGRLFGGGPNMPVVAEYGDHAITKDFAFMTAYPEARSLVVAGSLPAGVEATAFANTGPNSWAETDASEIKQGRVQFNEDTDTRGPVAVAVAATRRISEHASGVTSDSGEKKSRLVIFGDSDFAANYLFDFQKNGDLFLNALSWLAEEEDLISIRPKDPEDRRLNLTAAGSKMMLLVSVFLLPLASLLAAIVIYRRRK
ncbi:MAG: GldG family protein [bacterium]